MLISHPTLSVISQLLHKGKTPKNTNSNSLKEWFLRKTGFLPLKNYVIDQFHPSGISNSLFGKGIPPLKIRWGFSYLTFSCLGVTTGLSMKLPGTAWTCTNSLPNEKASMLCLRHDKAGWGDRENGVHYNPLRSPGTPLVGLNQESVGSNFDASQVTRNSCT